MAINKTETYGHYKSGLYEVIEIGLREGSLEQMVVYRSLQESGDYPSGTIWIRPENEFLEMIENDGEIIPRFKKVL